MNTSEIVRVLRSNAEVNTHAAIMLAAADEINRLQAELDKLNKRIADEGFSDLEKVSMNEIEYAIANLKDFLDLGQGDLQPASVELAIEALREQAERGKGCDFCLDLDGDNCDNGLYIDHTNRPAITTHDIYVPIDYCPMCGRHLTKEEA